jgi:hypothetical protein
MNYTYRNKNSDAGGSLETQTIGATAGNVVFNASPGTGKRWVILYGSILITCDGTVVNRNIRVQLTDGSDVLVEYYQSGNITASQENVRVSLAGPGMNPGNLSGLNDFLQSIGYAVIEGADQFRILVNGGVAGDSYSGSIRVLEYSI